MKRLALYARVSTGGQDAEIQSHDLRAYAERRGVEFELYVDQAVSGRKDRRPGLDRLLDDARRRRVDAVVVTKLDRLARSVRHLTELAATFEGLGVDLVVLDQGIDTSTPGGRLLFHVLAAVGEFEVDLIRERTRAGVAAARRKGRHPGRPRTLDAEGVRRVKRLQASKNSIRRIAQVLGVGRGTVERALKETPR